MQAAFTVNNFTRPASMFILVLYLVTVSTTATPRRPHESTLQGTMLSKFYSIDSKESTVL